MLEASEADEILITGMGGSLIAEILTKGSDKLSACKHLILSPHTEAVLVRKAIEDLDFHIEEESMTFDKGKYYVVIRAKKGSEEPMSLLELKYGPVLLKKRPEIFISYLRKELVKAEKIRENLEKEEKTERIRTAVCDTEMYIKELETLLSS